MLYLKQPIQVMNNTLFVPHFAFSPSLLLLSFHLLSLSLSFIYYLPHPFSEGGVLKVSEVMSHIMQVLKVPVLQRSLAVDYTQILVSHILPYPHFTMELTHSNWTGILTSLSFSL